MNTLEAIFAWCQQHAQRTAEAVNQPAGAESLYWAERVTGGWPWPEDVLSFYQWCDGSQRTPGGYLLPSLRPLPLHEVVLSWRTLMSIREPQAASYLSLAEDEQGPFFAQLAINSTANDAESSAPAGTESGIFVPQWLPIAEDQSGSYLMIDRRRKRRYGCAFVFDKVDADLGAPRWPSFTSLVEHVLIAMQSGTPVPSVSLRPVGNLDVVSWTR